MWPFRNKSAATAPPEEDTWSINQGTFDGKPIFARVNVSAASQGSDPQLPTRLGIAIPLKAPDANGMPHGAEFGELDSIEDCIVDALRTAGGARLVLVITTDGMREFVSYVPSAAVGEAVASQVRSLTATHEVQHYTEPDADWSVLDEFAEGSSDDQPDPSDEAGGSEVIDQAIELRKRGMMTEAAAVLAPLTSSEDLDIRIQALLELAVTHAILHEHQEVLTCMDQLEKSLNDHFGYNVLETQDDGGEDDGLDQVRLLRHTNAADAYSGLGRLDEAIHHARAAVAVVRRRREPGDEDRLAHREYVAATMLRSGGRLDEALAGLDAALKGAPSHIPSLIAKATYLELAGKKHEGEALFATINPADETGRAYFALNGSWYHGLRGDKPQMLKLLEEATYYWGGQSVVAYALGEKDFAPYREDPDFAACIERCRPLERGTKQ